MNEEDYEVDENRKPVSFRQRITTKNEEVFGLAPFFFLLVFGNFNRSTYKFQPDMEPQRLMEPQRVTDSVKLAVFVALGYLFTIQLLLATKDMSI